MNSEERAEKLVQRLDGITTMDSDQRRASKEAIRTAIDAAVEEANAMYKLAWAECEAHRNYPDTDDMNTGYPENEAVNLINMAKLGTAMDDHDAARRRAGLENTQP